MRIGIILLPELDWADDRHRWRRADELGFDHAWTYDHLAWRTLADGPWHATIPVLTGAALVTERIRLGTLVTSPNYRHPVVLAKDLMTLDVMSQGRLTVALGAGGTGFDAFVLGQEELTPGRRFARFVEFRQVLGELLANPVTSHSGEWYDVVDARMMPGPTQAPRPPLIVAAEGPKGMRLALDSASAPGDGWVTLGIVGGEAVSDAEWLAAVRRQAARMAEIEEERGAAAPDGFVRMLNMESRTATIGSVDHLADLLGEVSALGFTDVTLAWPRPGDPYRAEESLVERIGEALPELRRI